MNIKLRWMSVMSLVLLVLLALPLLVPAQTGSDGEEKQPLTKAQLTQLLAPVALYPDELLAQVLMASTYPLEIVMADRWVQQNRELKDDALAQALEKESWDPSVKSLVNFPSVLSMLSQKLDLTTKLGDVFLEQKADVMDTVQELRKKAAAAGNLKSTREQRVVVEDEVVVIEPSDPHVVYVPSYDPYVVYGPWWYPGYPPFYFYPPPYPGSVQFSYGYGISLGLAWGYAWGGWSWRDHDMFINVDRNVYYNPYINYRGYNSRYEPRRGRPGNGQIIWQHDPGHRRGVAYKQKATAREFGQTPYRRGGVRPDSRGFNPPGRRDGVPPGDAAGSGRRGGARSAIPKTVNESVFSVGGESGGDRARQSSERGRQSFDRGGSFRSGGERAPAGGGFRGSGGGSGDGRRKANDRR